TAKRHKQGCEVGYSLVHRHRLRSQVVVEVGGDTVEDGMPRFMCNYVTRQTGKYCLPRVPWVGKVKELEAVGLTLVECICPLACAGHDQQLRSIERPHEFAPEGLLILVVWEVGSLEEVHRAEYGGKDACLDESIR